MFSPELTRRSLKMRLCIAFCTLLTMLFAKGTMVGGEYHNVSTNNVTYIGFTSKATLNGTEKDALIYLGIPYAEPPIGDLRFNKPVLKRHANTTYNATYDRPACMQIPGPLYANFTEMSEDCLYLNIFIPGERLTNSSKNYSVMVWIHGGSFMEGSMHLYQGDVFSAFNDVIVVTMNYRLSVFGFLSTGDSASIGNYGLYDQQMALRWVHDNIGAFGGDSNSVTIFGESAGARSCFFHSLYPANKGLFQRVISQSGPQYSGSVMLTANIGEFGQFAGCNQTSSFDITRCLRSLSEQQILKIMTENRDKIKVGPVVDGDIVTASLVYDVLKNLSSQQAHHFLNLDFMIGYNDKDGTVFVDLWKSIAANNASVSNYSVNRYAFENVVIPVTLSLLYGLNSSFLSKALVQQYTDWNDPYNNYKRRASLLDFLTDIHFIYPAIFLANVHSKANTNSSTYLYEFAYRPNYDILSPNWLAGASHAVEIPIVFGLSSRMRKYLPFQSNVSSDTEISKIVMTLWTNFAKEGNPNHPEKLNFQWKQYEPITRDYLQFTKEMASSSVVRMYPGEPQMSFYFEVLPSLLETAKIIETMTSPAPCPTIQTCPTVTPCPTQITVGERFAVDIIEMENILIALIVASSALLVGIVFTCIYMCDRRKYGFDVI
ncbi:hypothetical protein CHS0354_025647 [Potamilus streckersoni]|uniref:Carboxylic ester hydrolase n=1 Tax=Potamilus streckersoni TaxID=2493646 RepID=A0AAE0RYP2_9BIVA|nr:hypothetical protein CHS0354_025647 [Potamilus streckersoni]